MRSASIHTPARSVLRRWLLGLAGAGGAILLLLMLPLLRPIEPARVRVPPDAQTIRVAAGSRYRAGPVRKLLFGGHYQEVWTEPVTAAVLRLDRFDGGLWPMREGGGWETRSLHLLSPSGRHWIFRSTDKELTRRLIPTFLQRSLLSRLLQDQVKAEHPGAVFVALPLQAALGLPSTSARLVVLADQERMGRFRSRFGGLLGTLQLAPGQDDPEPGESSSPGAIGTEELLAALAASSGHRVDQAGFLTAKLLDLLLNDWDRHGGQWRWVPHRMTWGTLWRPVPLDRDHALSRHDGVIVRLGRVFVPQLVGFDPASPSLRGLLHNNLDLDRRLLSGFPPMEWDSVTRFVQRRLSDSVIDAAVRRMPEGWRRVSGEAVAAALKQRRDQLPQVSERFRLYLQ